MSKKLTGKKIAFLAADGFEQCELTDPWEALEAEGADLQLVSLKRGKIQGMNHLEKADQFDVDVTVEEVSAEDFAGLVLPGGVVNPDTLRQNEDAVQFVRDFFKQQKPVSAICHGPVLLVEADVVDQRRMTSYPSIQTDILNAGGFWVDEECVVDEGLTTSRSPKDLKAFCAKTIEEMSEGKHKDQVADAA